MASCVIAVISQREEFSLKKLAEVLETSERNEFPKTNGKRVGEMVPRPER